MFILDLGERSCRKANGGRSGSLVLVSDVMMIPNEDYGTATTMVSYPEYGRKGYNGILPNSAVVYSKE